MSKEDFIKQIALLVQKYAPLYNIRVCSPIIAQAILESASGTSELAINAHNYFGLKYRNNRCPSSCGIYHKIGSEQNEDGTYSSSAMQWFKFEDMEQGVKGYFDFINISTYKNLKEIADPKTYLKKIKSDGYATSLNYVENLMNIIRDYDLTKFDKKENDKMKINIHAGHNPDGKIACGAIGLIKESTEARKIKDLVVDKLKTLGHTVYDCTIDNGISQNDVLKKIVTKCNAHSVDYDISIHFNSGAKDKIGNGKTTGVEVFTYSSLSKTNKVAKNICSSIASIGFKNRGLKHSKSLYFLKNTKSPALLIEVAFVDDKDDVSLYLSNIENISNAIVKGITGVSVVPNTVNDSIGTIPMSSYDLVFDAGYYSSKYPDLKAAFGTNHTKLLDHFKMFGMNEGRQAIATFNVTVYKDRYKDLRDSFGNNLPAYYKHYIDFGKNEGRIAT